MSPSELSPCGLRCRVSIGDWRPHLPINLAPRVSGIAQDLRLLASAVLKVEGAVQEWRLQWFTIVRASHVRVVEAHDGGFRASELRGLDFRRVARGSYCSYWLPSSSTSPMLHQASEAFPRRPAEEIPGVLRSASTKKPQRLCSRSGPCERE